MSIEHIGASGFEDREQSDNHLDGPFDTESHKSVRADPELAQVMSQLVGAAIQFSIGQLLVFKDHCDGGWSSLDLSFEQMDGMHLSWG